MKFRALTSVVSMCIALILPSSGFSDEREHSPEVLQSVFEVGCDWPREIGEEFDGALVATGEVYFHHLSGVSSPYAEAGAEIVSGGFLAAKVLDRSGKLLVEENLTILGGFSFRLNVDGVKTPGEGGMHLSMKERWKPSASKITYLHLDEDETTAVIDGKKYKLLCYLRPV